jgi:hypothetical protein
MTTEPDQECPYCSGARDLPCPDWPPKVTWDFAVDKHKKQPGVWVVFGLERDNELDCAVPKAFFSGPHARMRAYECADWLRGRVPEGPPTPPSSEEVLTELPEFLDRPGLIDMRAFQSGRKRKKKGE